MQGRRTFLQSGLGLGGSLLLGCDEEAPLRPRPRLTGQNCTEFSRATTASNDELVERGQLLGLEPFVGEDNVPLEQPLNSGLDGRLYTDLSRIGPGNLITPNETFYVRTRAPAELADAATWTIALAPSTEQPQQLTLSDLQQRTQDQGTHLLECSGNARGGGFGLLSSARWAGVPLLQVLEESGLVDASKLVLVSGFDTHAEPSANNHSTPGASWLFSFEQLADTGAFLATHMNDSELPLDHGRPVRLFVPGWYGCTCIKWVDSIDLVRDDAPATSQMQEFASRTHQQGVPALARDYLPANLQVAAMPTRVERWLVDGTVIHRMLGIVWGGREPYNAFEARLGNGDWLPVSMCGERQGTQTWSLWELIFSTEPGTYEVVLRASDPAVPQRRLDSQYYLRQFQVTS